MQPAGRLLLFPQQQGYDPGLDAQSVSLNTAPLPPSGFLFMAWAPESEVSSLSNARAAALHSSLVSIAMEQVTGPETSSYDGGPTGGGSGG